MYGDDINKDPYSTYSSSSEMQKVYSSLNNFITIIQNLNNAPKTTPSGNPTDSSFADIQKLLLQRSDPLHPLYQEWYYL
jgi:hypothetical protein